MEKSYFEMFEGEKLLNKLQNDVDFALTTLSVGIDAKYDGLSTEEVIELQGKAADLLIEAEGCIGKLLEHVEKLKNVDTKEKEQTQ